MKVWALLVLGATVSCSHAGANGAPPDAGDTGSGGEAGAAPDASAPLTLPPVCASDTQSPPQNLVCTGLYANIASKQIATGNAAYTPAVPLWSDGAQKQRWVRLPPGQSIDNSNPDEWSFPVGTKFWKEFSVGGHRIETRMWQKTDTNFWVDATYAWNADESAAVRSPGGDIQLATRTYHIPTSDECQDCHKGRTDRILGFDQVLLGLAGASGQTLEQLVNDGHLSTPPKSTPLVIGDDGTGLAAPALAWLHVNCGVTCHNRNANAMAWSTGMFLRLEPTLLDGRSVAGMDSLATTIGLPAVTPTWKGQTRIEAGDPAHSLLYALISHRGAGQQMPPIATSFVDEADIPLIEAWIAQMPTSSAGGASTGGASTGGASTGGANAGGASTGGASTGGANAGGAGGASPGGANAGGSSAGGSGATSLGGAAGTGSGAADAGDAEDAGTSLADASADQPDADAADASESD
jgi:hypothetical protein